MSTPSLLRRPALRGDDLLLAVLSTAAGPLLWWLGHAGLAPGAADGLRAAELLVASACAGAGALVAAWWFVAVLGTALAALGHRWHSVRMVRWGQAVSPRFLRRVTASCLGINLLVAPGAWAGTAETEGVATAPAHHSTVVRQQAVAPATQLPRPDWVAASQGAASDDRPARGELPAPTWRPSPPAPSVPGSGHPSRTHGVAPKSVTVRSGDCLWDIAAEELGPYATDLEVDRRWRQWYRLNHQAIGPDADVLAPGTVLQAPPIS